MGIVFMVIFLVDSLFVLTLEVWNVKFVWKNATMLAVSILIMGMLSLMLLKMGYWFDWFAPTIIIDYLI